MFKENNLKKLYLENFHINNNAKLISFAGYNMPISYSKGIIYEHLKTRSDCGLFDVSHMLQINIYIDKNTINKLGKVIPLDLHNFPVGKSYYSFILNQNGGIIDDLIISKLVDNNEYYFYIVLNASRRNIDLKILTEIIENKKLIHEKKDYCLLSLQGPKSRKILGNIIPEIQDLKFMEICQSKFENYKITVSCSGYTGEDGFELSIHNRVINQLLNKLIKYKDVNLCGLGSRDTLRLEAGLCLYGNELSEIVSPKEANLMWSIPRIRKERKDFLGANKFINNVKYRINKIRIGLESMSKAIPRANFDIFNNQNKLIGKVTSGSFSPSLKKPIAMGIINGDFAETGTKIFFKSRGKMENAIVCKLPFVSHKYKR